MGRRKTSKYIYLFIYSYSYFCVSYYVYILGNCACVHICVHVGCYNLKSDVFLKDFLPYALRQGLALKVGLNP